MAAVTLGHSVLVSEKSKNSGITTLDERTLANYERIAQAVKFAKLVGRDHLLSLNEIVSLHKRVMAVYNNLSTAPNK